MSPISNVSDMVRIQCLGKIRLGIKVASSEDKAGYPKPVDYFVCPKNCQSCFISRTKTRLPSSGCSVTPSPRG